MTMELTLEDKQRIKQEVDKCLSQIGARFEQDLFKVGTSHTHLEVNVKRYMIAIAEYVTRYEREQQSSAIKELSEFKEAARRQSLELYKLEAERTELRNKIQKRLDNVADLIGLVQQTNDTITMVRLQSEFSFLDDLLNSLKTKP